MSSGLKDKMYNYEVTPPPNTWDKIASALDESHLSSEFPAVLYNLESQPPANAWKKIEASLNEEQAIPQRRRIIPFLRYAAAAAIIFFLAWGSIQLFKGKNAEEEIAKEETTQPVTQPVVPSNNIPSTTNSENVTISDTKRDDVALENSKRTYASLDLPARNRARSLTASLYIEPVDPVNSLEINPQDTYKELQYADVHMDPDHQETLATTANRYIMLMTPEGNIIRMSKKLGDLLCCVAGEDVDEECKDQMKRWRQKLASSSVAPSTGNFMDILNLVKSLQDQ